jgi:hypothetical protein
MNARFEALLTEVTSRFDGDSVTTWPSWFMRKECPMIENLHAPVPRYHKQLRPQRQTLAL